MIIGAEINSEIKPNIFITALIILNILLISILGQIYFIIDLIGENKYEIAWLILIKVWRLNMVLNCFCVLESMSTIYELILICV